MIRLTGSISLFTREDWDARDPGPLTDQGFDAHEVFIHHTDDSASGIDSLSEQKSRMRGYQNYHMDSNGWSDIGYHYVVFPEFTTTAGTYIPARIFAGRRRNAVPAAQAGHNHGTLAIAVVGKGDDRMKRNQRYAVDVLINWLQGNGAPLRKLGGHRDVTGTSCPGDGIYNNDLPIIRDATNLARF